MQSEKGKGVWRSLMSLWLYSSGHSSRPSSVVELSVRLRPGGLRRDRHRSKQSSERSLVPEAEFEPTRPYGQGILSPRQGPRRADWPHHPRRLEVAGFLRVAWERGRAIAEAAEGAVVV
jgi:hypothetical protein